MNTNLFSSIFIMNQQTWDRMASALSSEDDIGVVLRIHLLSEKMIEAWCCAATENPSFFEGFGENLTMSYAAKLKLASNFGLNQYSYTELKEINRIRNARSHQIDNVQITDKEIQRLLRLIRDGGQEDFVDNHKFGIKVHGKSIFLHAPSISNREKFIAIFAAVLFRVTAQVSKTKDGFISLLKQS